MKSFFYIALNVVLLLGPKAWAKDESLKNALEPLIELNGLVSKGFPGFIGLSAFSDPYGPDRPDHDPLATPSFLGAFAAATIESLDTAANVDIDDALTVIINKTSTFAELLKSNHLRFNGAPVAARSLLVEAYNQFVLNILNAKRHHLGTGPKLLVTEAGLSTLSLFLIAVHGESYSRSMKFEFIKPLKRVEATTQDETQRVLARYSRMVMSTIPQLNRNAVVYGNEKSEMKAQDFNSALQSLALKYGVVVSGSRTRLNRILTGSSTRAEKCKSDILNISQEDFLKD